MNSLKSYCICMRLTFSVCVFCCISSAVAGVSLTVNGVSGGLRQFDPNTPLYLGISDTSSTNTYDLTITATGGEFGDITDPNSPMVVNDNTVNIDCSDVNDISTVKFGLSEQSSFAMVHLITNDQIEIDGEIADPNSIIYQLIVIENPDIDSIAVFSVDFAGLNYQQPWQSEDIPLEPEDIEPMEPTPPTFFFEDPSENPDVSGDGFVNFSDFSIFSTQWNETGIGLYCDFNGSAVVDANDLMHLVDYWLCNAETGDFSAEELPYFTDFRNYDPNESINNQHHWLVEQGAADIITITDDPNNMRKFVSLGANTFVSKAFNDEGEDNSVIRFEVLPESGAELEVSKDLSPFIGVRFGTSKIEVLDNGNYVASSQDNPSSWSKIKLEIDYDNDEYDVYYQDTAIYSGASFTDPNGFGSVSFFSSTSLKVDRFSITDETTAGGVIGISGSIYITTPCACPDDDLSGKIEIKGKVWWEDMSYYEILYWPVNEELPTYINDWHVACEGYNTVADGGIIGYWDTDILPDDYYYFAILVYDIQGNQFRYGVVTTDIYYNNQYLDYMPKSYSISSELKTNTFQQIEEKADIEVSWVGEFLFELRRSYNNSRRFYSKPLYNGHSFTYSNIRLTEYVSDDNCARGLNNWPRYDGAMLSSGEIFVVYPDGSSGVFECNQSSSGQLTTYYDAKTKSKQGDIVKRIASEIEIEWGLYYVDSIRYQLITKNGEIINFPSSNTDLSDYGYGYSGIVQVPSNSYAGGRTGWTTSSRSDALTDKFGNRLEFGWDNNNDLRRIYTSDFPDREILLTKTDGYYSKAELLLDDNVVRTVEYVHDSQSGEFSVIRKGDINQQPVNYTKTYYNDENFNLRAISSQNNFDLPDIWVDYDSYGRVADRWDFVEYIQGNYTSLQTHYEYGVDIDDKIYTTLAKTPYLSTITQSNEKGGVLSQVVITNDGSSSKNTYAQYSDSSHPTLPTQTKEVFDGKERVTTNEYDGDGNLTKQRVYIDDQSYALTEIDYQSSYSLPTRQSQWQDYLSDASGGDPNKTGPRVETINTYSDDPNGLSSAEGPYLVEQKRLIDSYIDEQSQEEVDILAVTKFTYHTNGRLKSKQVYQDYGLATQSIIEEEFTSIDSNGYPAFVWQGLIPTPNDPNLPLTASGYDETPQMRYFYNNIGEKILEANYLGSVKRYEYDDFGRIASVKTYNDSAAMTRSDFTDSPYAAMNPTISVEYGYDSRDNVVEEYHSTGKTISTYYNIANKPWLTLSTENTESQHEREEYIQYNSRGLEIYRSSFYWDGSGDIDDYPANFDENIVLSYYDYIERLTDKYWFDTNSDIATTEGYINAVNIIKHTKSAYGGNNNPVLQQLYGYGNSLETAVAIDYDMLDRQSKVTVSPGNLGITTEYYYDAVGNKIYTIDPAGNVLITGYDNSNRKIAEYFTVDKHYIDVLANPEDPNDTSTVSVFDFDETLEFAKLRSEFFYYDNDKIESRISYDNDGSTILAYKSFEYDKRGRISKVTEDIEAFTSADTEYTYSDTGELGTAGDLNYHIKVTDGEDKDTYTKLNFAGRPLKILHSSGDYEEYEYTDDNLLYKEALWNSVGTKQWIEYSYDGFGSENLKTYPDTGFVETSYDGLGRKILVSDSRNSSDNIGGCGDINYYYDALGRLSSYIDQDEYSIYYFYKADGQKETIKVFDNSQTPQLVYEQWYFYDGAGRFTSATCGDPMDLSNSYLAEIDYDDNGNRDLLRYYIDGNGLGGDTVSIDYSYNIQNQLTSFATTGVIFSFDADSAGDIDGLGRLAEATESIGTSTYTLEYNYNDRSYLTSWQVNTTTGSLTYDLAGNITNYGTDTYSYTGDLLTSVGSNSLDWDYNGAMTSNLSSSIVRNPDGQIQSAVVGIDSIACKYTPEGDMILKTVSNGTNSATEKYILDITGKYPVVLLVIDAGDDSITNEYYYTSNKELLSQHIGGEKYFYLKDRLGSIRAMIDDTGSIVNSYTYTPFGDSFTESETINNRFKFAGYQFDETTELYYLNARWYDPVLMRFTSRDPVRGSFQEPMTLHQYLYCLNNPINMVDPDGEFAFTFASLMISRAIDDAFRNSAYRYQIKAGLLAAGFVSDVIAGYSTYRWAKNRADDIVEESPHGETRQGGEGEIVDWVEDLLGTAE